MRSYFILHMAYRKIKLEDIEKIEIKYYPRGTKPLQVRKETRANYIINLGAFDKNTLIPTTRFIENGNLHGHMHSLKGFRIDENEITYKDNIMENLDAQHFICGAPTLVIDGEINIDTTDLTDWLKKSKRNRVAIGTNNEDLIIYTSEHYITLERTAQEMLDYGCKYSISCDSAGRASMLDKGVYKCKYYDGSLIPSFLCIYLKKEPYLLHEYPEGMTYWMRYDWFKAVTISEITDNEAPQSNLTKEELMCCFKKMYDYIKGGNILDSKED